MGFGFGGSGALYYAMANAFPEFEGSVDPAVKAVASFHGKIGSDGEIEKVVDNPALASLTSPTVEDGGDGDGLDGGSWPGAAAEGSKGGSWQGAGSGGDGGGSWPGASGGDGSWPGAPGDSTDSGSQGESALPGVSSVANNSSADYDTDSGFDLGAPSGSEGNSSSPSFSLNSTDGGSAPLAGQAASTVGASSC